MNLGQALDPWTGRIDPARTRPEQGRPGAGGGPPPTRRVHVARDERREWHSVERGKSIRQRAREFLEAAPDLGHTSRQLAQALDVELAQMAVILSEMYRLHHEVARTGTRREYHYQARPRRRPREQKRA